MVLAARTPGTARQGARLKRCIYPKIPEYSSDFVADVTFSAGGDAIYYPLTDLRRHESLGPRFGNYDASQLHEVRLALELRTGGTHH